MKKIWILNQYASPPEFEVRVRNNMMALYLTKMNYEVKIISASSIHNTNIDLIKDNEKFIKKRYGQLNFIHIKTSQYVGNGLSRIKTMLEFPIKFCRLYKEFGEVPDLIICDLDAIFFPFAKYVSKKVGCPVFLEVRDLWPASIGVYKNISDKNILMKFLYHIEKKAYIQCDQLIFSMSGGYEYIKDKKWDKYIDKNKVHYINNGIDLATFHYNRENYIYSDIELENDTNFKVFYVGSIRLANGVKNIINIAEIILKMNENISFYIFGDGDEKEELMNYCLENKISNVHFKGSIDKKFVPSALRFSDLNIIHFKNSKLKKYGASLNKLFEYLASGKPILCDCVFHQDIINENQCGISIDNQNSTVLAEKVLELKNLDESKYKELCNNCLKTSEKYDYQILTEKLEKIIEIYGGNKI